MLKNFAAAIVALLILSACGQMGPLYLPTPEATKNHSQTNLDKMVQSS